MKTNKSLEAFDYFVCERVQQCFYHDIHSACKSCFIKSKVRINSFEESEIMSYISEAAVRKCSVEKLL